MRPKSEPYSRECAGWQFKARRLARDTRRRDARASRCTRVSEKRDGGFTGRGGLQRWPVKLVGSGRASRPRTARQSRWLLSCDWHFARPLQPPSRFSEPLMNDSLHQKGCDGVCTQNAPVHKTCAVARAGTAKPGANAPARPERSEGARREDYAVGVGGWMLLNQTRSPTRRPLLTTCVAAQ